MREFLKSVKENGAIPPDHRSQDCQDEKNKCALKDSAYRDLAVRFQRIEDEQQKKGIRIIWGLVDGFLMYWDHVNFDILVVPLFC